MTTEADSDMYLDIDALPEPKMLEPGTIVAERYRIVDSIGKGGMGIVYKASNIHMGKTVAMKLMLQETSTNSQDYRRFQREAQAASLLDHPNIVSIHDFGFSGRQAYLCMDYLEGTSLDLLVEKQPLTVDQFRHIFAQACDALQHAHDKGIVHRDLKPSNIMITERRGDKNYVVILDFGLVKMMESGSDHKLTATNMVVGSPLYMSPEQCRAQPLDQRSDIYSLGCVMYEALTGVPPLMADTIFDLMNAHISQEPAPLRDALPGLYVPAALERVILQALAKDPAKRFQSMNELAKAIEASFSGAPELAVSRSTPAIKNGNGNLAAGRSQELRRKKEQVPRGVYAAVIGWIIVASVITAGIFFKNQTKTQLSSIQKNESTGSSLKATDHVTGAAADQLNNQTTAKTAKSINLQPVAALHYPQDKETASTQPSNTVPSKLPETSTSPVQTSGQIPNPVPPLTRAAEPVQINSTPARNLTPEQLLAEANSSFSIRDFQAAKQKYEMVLRERSSYDVQGPVTERLVICCYYLRDGNLQEYVNRFKSFFNSNPRYADSDLTLLQEALQIANSLGRDEQFWERVTHYLIENARTPSEETIRMKMDMSKYYHDKGNTTEALRYIELALRDAESIGSQKKQEIALHLQRIKGPPAGMGGGFGGPLGGGPISGGPMSGGPMGGGPMGGGPMGGGPMNGGPMGGPPGGEDGGMFGPR